MAIAQLTGERVPVELWTDPAEIEASALTQLRQMAALPWAFHHVAVMPDVHFGKGATVGSVVAMRGALAPAAVGVDIGCGMGAVRTNLGAADLPDNLHRLRSQLELAIPVGFATHDAPPLGRRDEGALGSEYRALFAEFDQLDGHVQPLQGKARRQLGTLGGGNHFIELCLDEADRVWLLLHSGSRNIGKELAEIHIAKARQLAHNAELPNRDLAVFLAATPEMAAYRHDLFWAQRYAALNREVLFALYRDVVTSFFDGRSVTFEEPISCHHNYVAEESHFGEEVLVTRKGAISARAGERGIIPGSMGTRSYIVTGLGNPQSFTSASHGAGRRMSRGQAKRQFTTVDLARQTAGIECRKDAGVLDEIPAAYKDIDQVMANQADLVRIDHTLRQLLCVKG